MSRKVSFGSGYTMFSDYSLPEFKFMLGSKANYESSRVLTVLNTNTPTPAAVDWRRYGYVSPVLFSGAGCASSYMFAVVGAIETAFSI